MILLQDRKDLNMKTYCNENLKTLTINASKL